MLEPTKAELQNKRIAAEYLGANALELIKQILIKHDQAILEASFETITDAVKAEREACCILLEGMHEGAKHAHNYYLHAAQELRRLRAHK